MSVVFRNVIPQKEALTIIDREKHPRVYKYAQTSAEKGVSANAHRLALWIQGYKRFGDEFEKTLEVHGRRFRRALSLGRELEGNLPDKWMLVGLLASELPSGVQALQRALAKPGIPLHPALAQMHMNKKKWNPEHDKVIAWIPEDRLRYDYQNRAAWSDSVRIFNGQKEPWTMDEALLVLDTISYDEAKELHKVDALKDPRKMLLHYTEGMPIEFLAAM